MKTAAGMPPGPRIGLDVVEVADIRRALARWGELYLRRILSAAEQRWSLAGAQPDRLTAVCLAVKEGTIKALGGRPPSFSWLDIELVTTRPAVAPPEWVRQMGLELMHSAGLQRLAYLPVALHGAAVVWAGEGGGAGTGCRRQLWAAYGWTEEEAWALVAMW